MNSQKILSCVCACVLASSLAACGSSSDLAQKISEADASGRDAASAAAVAAAASPESGEGNVSPGGQEQADASADSPAESNTAGAGGGRLLKDGIAVAEQEQDPAEAPEAIVLDVTGWRDVVENEDAEEYHILYECSTSLLYIVTPGFDRMNEVLKERNDSAVKALQQAKKKDLPIQRKYYQDTGAGGSYSFAEHAARADRRVLSLVREVNKAVGDEYISRVTTCCYDTETADELKLGDVVTDLGKLYRAALEAMEKSGGEEYFYLPDYAAKLEELLVDQGGAEALWALDGQGLTLYFNPGEGIVDSSYLYHSASVPYEELHGILRRVYDLSGHGSSVPFTDNNYSTDSISADIDGDGETEVIVVTGPGPMDYPDVVTPESVDVTVAIYEFSDDDADREYVFSLPGFVSKCWLVRLSDGHPYLYIRTISLQYQTVWIDLAAKDGAEMAGTTQLYAPGEAFGCPDDLILYSRGDFLGNYALCMRYQAVPYAGGLPLQTGGEYQIVNYPGLYCEYGDYETPYGHDQMTHTLKTNIHATELDAEEVRAVAGMDGGIDRTSQAWLDAGGAVGNLEGKDVTLKKGTVLFPRWTDNASYMVYETEDGRYIRLAAQEDDARMGWKINGISEFDLFEEQHYAD